MNKKKISPMDSKKKKINKRRIPTDSGGSVGWSLLLIKNHYTLVPNVPQCSCSYVLLAFS
jgi:hypothetical protein